MMKNLWLEVIRLKQEWPVGTVVEMPSCITYAPFTNSPGDRCVIKGYHHHDGRWLIQIGKGGYSTDITKYLKKA